LRSFTLSGSHQADYALSAGEGNENNPSFSFLEGIDHLPVTTCTCRPARRRRRPRSVGPATCRLRGPPAKSSWSAGSLLAGCRSSRQRRPMRRDACQHFRSRGRRHGCGGRI